jgi:hypothetical protein
MNRTIRLLGSINQGVFNTLYPWYKHARLNDIYLHFMHYGLYIAGASQGQSPTVNSAIVSALKQEESCPELSARCTVFSSFKTILEWIFQNNK